MSSKNYNDGLYEIAEAIREHAKNIDSLSTQLEIFNTRFEEGMIQISESITYEGEIECT